MGFFAWGNKSNTGLLGRSGLSLDLIHRSECIVCPMNHAPGLCHPKMGAHGSLSPLVTLIGEAPGETEDERGIPFIGPSGQLLRKYLPKKYRDRVRFNNVVRCLPGSKGDRTPELVQIESCRPSLIRDIEETKPRLIIAFGNTALSWFIGQQGIGKWSGRLMPVRVGRHDCWMYPIQHPASVLYEEARARKLGKNFRRGKYETDHEFLFAMQMADAFRMVEGLAEPDVHDQEMALSGIETVDGRGGQADLDLILDFIKSVRDQVVIGFDYETNRKRPWHPGAKMLSVAFAGEGRSVAVALDHPGARWRREDRADLQDMLGDFICRSRHRFVSHNLSFELEWTAHHFGNEVIWGGSWEDTMGQAYVLDERQGNLSLEDLVLQYFGLNIKAIDNLDRGRLEEAPLDSVLRYNSLDARYHRLLYVRQWRRLKVENRLETYRQQRDRTIAAAAVGRKGIPIDQDKVEELYRKYARQRTKIEDSLREEPDVQRFAKVVGHPYRPSASHDQLAFAKKVLGRRIDDTKKVTLDEIDHPVMDKTVRWRQVNKLMSTYVLPVVRGLPKELRVPDSPHVSSDGRAYPTLGTTKVVTWRTSCSEPNAQNWPKRTKEGVEARSQVAAPPGYKIVAIDYAGIDRWWQKRLMRGERGRLTRFKRMTKPRMSRGWRRHVRREKAKRAGGWAGRRSTAPLVIV